VNAARLNPILQELRHGLDGIYGRRLAALVLFGSQARNEAASDSDIDVLVVLRGKVNPGLEIQRLSPFTSKLMLKHEVVIACAYISNEDFETEQSPLMLNVRREGVSL
jgi:predicted nucleotidyltransferase